VITRTRGAIAGFVAGAVALAVGELVAGIGASRNAPVIAVGNSVIDAVPRPVKDFAIETFGTNDKVALLVGIYTVIALIAIALGVASTRRWTTGAVGIGAFGLVGLVAVVQQGTDVSIAELLAPILGAAAGIVTLWLLLRPRPEGAPASADLERRRFLTMTAGAVGVAALAGSMGRFLQSRVSAAASRLAVVLPRPMRAAASIPAGADLGIEDLSPFITPNGSFYRIDVNLVVPQVEAEGWRLKVHGRVDTELELTFDDVLSRDMVEEDITLACVSNEIGGRLVGNARWLGTPLLPLLEEAGIDPSADQVIARAVDGFTVGFPVEALRDGRAALLAIGMNGEPLPIDHGFPARLVIAGLYGYVSATKWITELELSTFADFDPYWIKRGWAAEAPVKTAARIDTPSGLQRILVADGPVAIAGVAWAQTRGIAKVELRIDDGEWQACELSDEVSVNTWRQWVYRWTDPVPGRRQLTVRATDGDGETQTEERVAPFPDGATGWHSIAVNVQ
jgi:DMSO/TMAO reductase YedYZ molybdopterin-dependent catalytic subunit